MSFSPNHIRERIKAPGGTPGNAVEPLALTFRLAGLVAESVISRLGGKILKIRRLSEVPGSLCGQAHAARLDAVLRYRVADHLTALAQNALAFSQKGGRLTGPADPFPLLAGVPFKCGHPAEALKLNFKNQGRQRSLDDLRGTVRCLNGSCPQRLDKPGPAMPGCLKARDLASENGGLKVQAGWREAAATLALFLIAAAILPGLALAQRPDSSGYLLDPRTLIQEAQSLSDSMAIAIHRLQLKPAISLKAKYIVSAQKTIPSTQPLLSQEVRMSMEPVRPSSFRIQLGLRTDRITAADYSQGLALSLDEACLQLEPWPWARASLGRLYFVLDRLGLLADNINDAFEGASLDLGLFGRKLELSAVASRQSSMNYPFRRFFISVDDYYAGRLSLDLDRLALGGTWLASGIASERGFGGDFYLRLGSRQLAAEYARYRPSESSWFEEIKWCQAWVAGLDLVASGPLNVFLQMAAIDRGFTPMASSLLYSSGGRHLYFDQNTTGVDLTTSYILGKASRDPDEALARGAKPDRQFTLRPHPIAEAEWVGLWDRSRRPHTHRFIGRLAWPLGDRLNLLSEYWYAILRRESSEELWRGQGAGLTLVFAF